MADPRKTVRLDRSTHRARLDHVGAHAFTLEIPGAAAGC